MVAMVPKLALGRWMDDLAKHTDYPLEVVILADEPPLPDLMKKSKVRIRTFKKAKDRYHYLLSERGPPVSGTKRIILLNYELLPSFDSHRRRSGDNSIRTDFLALDEVHLLKNIKSKTAQAVFGTDNGEGAVEADYLFLMSGTPLENKPGDLLAFMKYLSRGGTSDAEHFFQELDRRRFATTFRETDVARLSNLFGYLSERMIRRLKQDVVTGLPVKREITIALDPITGRMIQDGKTAQVLPGDYRRQLDLYELALTQPDEFERRYTERNVETEEERSEEESEWEAATRKVGSVQLTRLRQTGIDPGIFIGEADSIKVDAVEQLIRERLAQGKSIGIFTDYKTASTRLRDYLMQKGYGDILAYVDGDVTRKGRRQKEIDRIQNKEAKIIVATTATMGLAVELTQLDSIIWLNRPWKPSTYHQAVDRAHRYDPIRNYPGKILEIINLDLDLPVSIDRLIAGLLRRKEILAEMIVNGNLTPEILAAFRDLDATVIEAIQEATASPVSFDEFERTLAQQFRLLLGRILNEPDPERQRELWDEAAAFYISILEHKGSFFANMASLDHLAGDAYPELKTGGPKTVLDLASGPSTLYRAYDRRQREFIARNFRLDITDYDVSREMLRYGVARPGRQMLGTFEGLSELPSDSYDIVNLSYAFRYAAHPGESIRNIYRILKNGGLFVLILPSSNLIPPRFYEALRDMGFELRVGEGAELESKLGAQTYAEFVRQYGKEFADDMARMVKGKFTYLVAHKEPDRETAAGEFTDDDFRLLRELPLVNPEKIQAIQQNPGEFKLVPDGAFVTGEVKYEDLDRVHQRAVLNERKAQTGIRFQLKQILNLLGGLSRMDPAAKASRRQREEMEQEIEERFDELKTKIEDFRAEFPRANTADLIQELERIREQDVFRLRIRKSYEPKIQEVITSLRSEVRNSESKPAPASEEKGKAAVRNYADAYLSGADTSAAKQALLAYSEHGFEVHVSKKDENAETGKITFLIAGGKHREGGKFGAIQHLPAGAKAMIYPKEDGEGKLYLELKITGHETLYYEFTREKKSYLGSRPAPGYEESERAKEIVRQYAEAYLTGADTSAAKQVLLAYSEEGFNVRVPKKDKNDKKGAIIFPVAGGISKKGGKSGLIAHLPAGAEGLIYPKLDKKGELYLELRIENREASYHEFTFENKRSYLKPRVAPGQKEVQEYAQAYLTGADTLEARQSLLAYSEHGFEVHVSKKDENAETGKITFPIAGGKHREGGKLGLIADLPAGAKGMIYPKEDKKGELYLELRIEGRAVSYHEFTLERESYLKPRAAPDYEEDKEAKKAVKQYAEAYLSGADTSEAKQALLAYSEQGFKVQVSKKDENAKTGYITLPLTGGKRREGGKSGEIANLSAGANGIIYPKEDKKGELYLELRIENREASYHEFTRERKSYLKYRAAPGEKEVQEYAQAYLSGADTSEAKKALLAYSEEGFKVRVPKKDENSKIGQITFPVAGGKTKRGGKLGRILRLLAGAVITIYPKEDKLTGNVYLYVQVPEERGRYYQFSHRNTTSYLESVAVSDDWDVGRFFAEQSGKPEIVYGWIKQQYERSGDFESPAMDLSSIMNEVDKQKGLVPAGFPVPKKNRKGEYESISEDTRNAGAGKNLTGLKATITKQSAKLSIEFIGFRGRSEVRIAEPFLSERPISPDIVRRLTRNLKDEWARSESVENVLNRFQDDIFQDIDTSQNLLRDGSLGFKQFADTGQIFIREIISLFDRFGLPIALNEAQAVTQILNTNFVTPSAYTKEHFNQARVLFNGIQTIHQKAVVEDRSLKKLLRRWLSSSHSSEIASDWLEDYLRTVRDTLALKPDLTVRLFTDSEAERRDFTKLRDLLIDEWGAREEAKTIRRRIEIIDSKAKVSTEDRRSPIDLVLVDHASPETLKEFRALQAFDSAEDLKGNSLDQVTPAARFLASLASLSEAAVEGLAKFKYENGIIVKAENESAFNPFALLVQLIAQEARAEIRTSMSA